MENKLSSSKLLAQASRSATVGSSNRGKEADSLHRLEQLLAGSGAEQLGSRVHDVISLKDMDLLRLLVDCHKAPLEEKNEWGMTPLYHSVFCNWPEGALFLLEQGADIKNSELAPRNLGSSHKTFLLLALETKSRPLLRELLKKGVSIRLETIDSHAYGVPVHKSQADLLFDCMASAVTEQGSGHPNLLKDLIHVVSTGAKYHASDKLIKDFIKKQCSYHQSKMLQVVAACLLCRLIVCHTEAFNCLKMSAQLTPCQLHDHKAEEEMACRSIFAGILDMQHHVFTDRMAYRDWMLALHIQALHALLTIDKYIAEDDFLLKVSIHLLCFLRCEGMCVTTVGVLWRLTTLRQLPMLLVINVVNTLSPAIETLGETSEVSFSVVFESMETIQNCLSSLKALHSDVHRTVAPSFESTLKSVFQDLFEVLLLTMSIVYSHKVPATPEQLHDFASHIKNFIRAFPWTFCPDSFHRLAQDEWHCSISTSMIKVLVEYSAEAWGTVRQKSAPHLLLDWHGNTPLHSLALLRSRRDLVHGGVLQHFLDFGSDLCTRNNQGETVRSILVRLGVCTEGELLPSLQCLAATAFMRDGRLRQSVQNCGPDAVKNFLLDH